MKQKWICNDCKVENEIEMPDHIDVMSAVYLIQENHEMVSPSCENDVRNIRVENNASVESQCPKTLPILDPQKELLKEHRKKNENLLALIVSCIIKIPRICGRFFVPK